MSQPKAPLRQYVLSILAAALGVQSNAARERDSSQGSLLVFIIGGFAFVTVFVVILVIIANAIVATV